MSELKFPPISQEQIRDYAQASEDFNPIHLDDAVARAAGLPGVIAHGMLAMGLAARALEQAGVRSQELEYLEAKFKDKVLVGDVLTAIVTAAPSSDSRSGEKMIATLLNQRGQQVVVATAVLRR